MLYALIAITDDAENKGDEDRPYWKYSGGEQVVLTNLSVQDAWEIEYGFRNVDQQVNAVEIDNCFYRSWVVATQFIPMSFVKDGRLDYETYYEAVYNDGEMRRIKDEVRNAIEGYKDFAACNPPVANENVMPKHRLVLDWWAGEGRFKA